MVKERISRDKNIIIHYYLVTGIALFLFSLFARKETAMDPVIYTILVTYLLLFPIVILYVRKYAVHIFLFFLAFITGFYSFYHYSLEHHSFLNALYFTFQLYLLTVSDVFTSDGSVMLEYPLIVEIARWSAALYTISTVFIAMYRMLENSILLVFYQITGNHTILFGYNENTMMLIEDLRKSKKRVILVAESIPDEAVDYFEALKVVIVRHHDNEDNIYTRCGVERAEKVVFLHEEDVDNLNAFTDFWNDYTKHDRKNQELTVYIHLKETVSRKLFSELEQTITKDERAFQVQQINLYESFVKTLFKTHPLFKGKQESHAHLLIIGFGSLGQQIALQAVFQHKQFGKKPLYITALDKAILHIQPEWQQSYPEVQKHVSIDFRSFDITKDALRTVIQEQQQPITHIYICLHDDELDLWAGIELSNQFPHIPIYLEFSYSSFAAKWLESEVSGTRLMYSLGAFKDVLTERGLFYFNKN